MMRSYHPIHPIDHALRSAENRQDWNDIDSISLAQPTGPSRDGDDGHFHPNRSFWSWYRDRFGGTLRFNAAAFVPPALYWMLAMKRCLEEWPRHM